MRRRNKRANLRAAGGAGAGGPGGGGEEPSDGRITSSGSCSTYGMYITTVGV